MLTMSEQILRTRGELALERLAAAKRGGDLIEIAQAKVAVTHVRAELEKAGAASGAAGLAAMRRALTRSMTV
jgi:hypothetical protein